MNRIEDRGVLGWGGVRGGGLEEEGREEKEEVVGQVVNVYSGYCIPISTHPE